MKELNPFNPEENGDRPRWVIYPDFIGEHDIVGPLSRKSAKELARDTGGLVFAEEPIIGESQYVNLKMDDE